MFFRVIQTFGDSAFGHHALSLYFIARFRPSAIPPSVIAL
jgi:hypothetical protein